MPGTGNDRRWSDVGGMSLRGDLHRMDQAQKLRDLAAWYREFAERAGNPAIWDARLRMAEELEKEAGSLEDRRERRLVREH